MTALPSFTKRVLAANGNGRCSVPETSRNPTLLTVTISFLNVCPLLLSFPVMPFPLGGTCSQWPATSLQRGAAGKGHPQPAPYDGSRLQLQLHCGLPPAEVLPSTWYFVWHMSDALLRGPAFYKEHVKNTLVLHSALAASLPLFKNEFLSPESPESPGSTP